MLNVRKTGTGRNVAATMGLVAVAGLWCGCATPKGGTVEERRDYVQGMADDALAEAFEQRPSLREKVSGAPGYGVFSNIGTNIIFVSTGGGYGLIHNNETGEDTYMRMGEIGVGLGLGVKDFRAVFIFNDAPTMRNFIENGWEWGGEADAAAKVGDQGGAAEAAGNIDSGIEVYQFTENGLALSATVSGTKYWKDKSLN